MPCPRPAPAPRRAVADEALATVASAASSLALPNVLDAALAMATRAIPCDLGLVTLADEDGTTLRVAAAHGRDGGAYLAVTIPVERGHNGRAYRERRPLLLDALPIDPRRFTIPGLTDPLTTALCVPLVTHDRALGTLYLARYAPDSFTEADLRLLADLAGPVALAVDHARLHALAQRRAERAEALHEIGRHLAAELDFERVLTLAWQQLIRAVPVEECWLACWDEAREELELLLYVSGGVRRHDWQVRLRPREGKGLVCAVLAERRTIQTPDYLAECQRRGLEPVMPPGDWRGLAWLGVPLLTGGRLVGVLGMERRPGVFGAEEAALLETLAGQVAAALENARLYREARRLAATDPLTGLSNHRHVQERLDEEVARAARHGHPLVVAMLDLDRFKQINDTAGHLTGDRILQLVAEALRAEARASDVVGRYGGDEFILILPETTRAGARALIDRARARLRAAPLPPELALAPAVDLSAGIAVYPDDATRRQELLALADRGLYECKQAGAATSRPGP